MSTFKGSRVANAILKKMIKIGGPIFSAINTQLKIKVIKVVCYVKPIQTNRPKEQKREFRHRPKHIIGIGLMAKMSQQKDEKTVI